MSNMLAHTKRANKAESEREREVSLPLGYHLSLCHCFATKRAM